MNTLKASARHAGCAAALLAVLAGCNPQNIVGGGSVQIAGAAPSDGYLPQPELLAHGNGLWDLSYLRPGTDVHRYSAIYIAPVEIITGGGSSLASLPADQRANLANTFYADIVKTVSKSCSVARKPGPGVIVFNIALSDATSSDGAAKTVATYAPYVGVAYALGSKVFNGGVGYFSGTAAAEGYATDGGTGELLWEGVDKRGGNTPLIANTTDKWLDVHHVFEAWAGQLVTRLQQLGVCEPAS